MESPWMDVAMHAANYLPRRKTEAPTPEQHAQAIDLMDKRNAAHDLVRMLRWEIDSCDREYRRHRAIAAAMREQIPGLEMSAEAMVSVVAFEASAAFLADELREMQAELPQAELAAKEIQAEWEVFEGTRHLRKEENGYQAGLVETQKVLRETARTPPPRQLGDCPKCGWANNTMIRVRCRHCGTLLPDSEVPGVARAAVDQEGSP